MKSKTIILSNPNQNSSQTGRGILSFYIEDGILICKIRLYNISPFDRHTKLAVYHQNEVYSANLLEKNGCFETSLVGNFDIDKDFYTAVIDTTNNNNIIIAGGTYAGFFFENSILQTDSISQSSIDTKKLDTEQIGDCNNCPDCTHCKYKEYFYQSQQEKTESENKVQTLEESELIKEEQTAIPVTAETSIPESLIESLIPQFNYLFEKYPLDENLMKLIENSKFVEMSENSQTFSIGAIYENSKLKYICYAVKSSYNNPAPTELGDHYQWVPTDAEDPLSDGYYIVFQDATDLKIVEL